VLNLSTGQYFGFNPSAATVWEALIGGACPTDIADAMAPARDIDGFINALGTNALTVTDEGEPAPVAPEMARRLAALDRDPELEMFDDLADLIVADPIHDTDEAKGWPVRAASA